MDTTKAIRPEMLNSNEGKIKTFYRLAKNADSQFKEDYYANRAIFISEKVAKQETLKQHQREMRNNTFAYDSNSNFTGSRRVASRCHSSVIHACDEGGESEGNATVISSVTNCIGIYSSFDETPDDEKHEFLDIIELLSKKSNCTKFVTAYFLLSTSYSEQLTPSLELVFKEEFRSLESFRDAEGEISVNVLWERFNYSVQEVKLSREYVRKMFARSFKSAK